MSGFNCESKIKSSPEYLKAENMESKTYGKIGTSDKNAKISVGQGKMKLEGEIGEYKMNFEADSKKEKEVLRLSIVKT
jgi:hypothetical protein